MTQFAEGDRLTISMAKPRWWQFRKMRQWRRMQPLLGSYEITSVSSNVIRIGDD